MTNTCLHNNVYSVTWPAMEVDTVKFNLTSKIMNKCQGKLLVKKIKMLYQCYTPKKKKKS